MNVGQRCSRQLLALLLVVLMTCGGSPIVNAQATVEGPWAEGVGTGAGDQPAPTTIENEFVRAADGHFRVGNSLFRHVGVNAAAFVYHTESEQWMDTWYMERAGIRQLRVFLANNRYTTQEIGDRLARAAYIAGARGIRLTVAFTNFYRARYLANEARGGESLVAGDEGFYTDVCCGGVHIQNHEWPEGGFRKHYKPFVEAIVNRFKNDGRIFAWEVGNEIGYSGHPYDDRIVDFYLEMAGRIKQLDPNHMVTTGIISTGWLPLTEAQKRRLYGSPSVDYLTEHYYDPGDQRDLQDKYLATELNKPLVIEEYGVSQWDYPREEIVPRVSSFFESAYTDPVKSADAVLIWGVEFEYGHGSGDAKFGPLDQGLVDHHLILWRDWADWLRPTSRYPDVQPGHPFYPFIECLSNRRAVSGDVDASNNFNPYASLTRARAVKATVLAMGFPLLNPPNPTFSDVPRLHPYYRYIETAVAQGIIGGYADGTFRPDNTVTRGQMSKIVVVAGQRRYGWPIDTSGGPHFSDVPPGSTFYQFVETAYNRGLVSGYADGTFRPGNHAARAHIAKMLSLGIRCQ